MIAPLAKFIDWSALQVVFAFWLRSVSTSKWKLEEALEFLNGPDFIPAASDPAQIEFDGPRHFKFSTPGLASRVLRWLAPRLDKPFSPDPRTPPNALEPTPTAP